MRQLYNTLTATQVIDLLTGIVVEEKGISKAMAKKLVLNALIHNCVIDEIVGQVKWLMEDDDEQQKSYDDVTLVLS